MTNGSSAVVQKLWNYCSILRDDGLSYGDYVEQLTFLMFLVQSRPFADMLEATIRKYQNRTIEAAQVIAELIELAKQMREGQKRGEKLGLTNDEVAFYDALEVNDSAVKVLGEPALKNIARELVTHVRRSVTIDWTLREAAQAQIRVIVRRILRKYGYPPDKQEKATQTVLEQAKLLCAE